MTTRSHVAHLAAEKIAAINPAPALVGFDGFIDSIVHMVDRRTDMSPTGYTRLHTIPEFAARCAAAAGRSTNIEQVLIEDRFGGNGPLMAGALASLGVATTYIGAVGDGGDRVHGVFEAFAARCERVIPTGPPSNTLCLEFDDGKLMFNNTANVQAVTWDRIKALAGLERLIKYIGAARLIGIVNWSLQGGVPGIWRGLATEVFPLLTGERRIMIDLSDPAERSDADIAGALAQLRELEALPGVSITLGLNQSEAERIAAVCGAASRGDAGTLGAAMRETAARIRAKTALDCVVVHPREGAAGATAAESAWFDGPFTATPRLSTGAGDHFNGGFAFGQVHGLTLAESLACGCAVSGAYVRDARSPTIARLTGFLADLPMPGAE